MNACKLPPDLPDLSYIEQDLRGVWDIWVPEHFNGKEWKIVNLVTGPDGLVLQNIKPKNNE